MLCNKVKSVNPLAWAPFPGFSLLFDSPGKNIRMEDGVPRLHCDLTDPVLALYAALAAASEDLPELADYGLCQLPPETYHVTFADGLSAANVHHLAQPALAETEAFLNPLPTSVPAPLPGWFLPRTLSLSQPWAVRLRVSKLSIWPAAPALVARLEPADEASAAALEILTAARQACEQPMVERGKPANSPAYHPHISIGYFATSEQAEAANALLPEWNRRVLERVAGLTLATASISLYSFTDMANFYLHRQPVMIVRQSVSEAAIDSKTGLIGENGDQKIALTLLTTWHERFGASSEWTPRLPNGKRHALVGPGLEAALFDERAEQNRHAHRSVSEIYTVLRGNMHIQIEATDYVLAAGDTAVIHPGAVHLVKPGGPFLARVVSTGFGPEPNRTQVDAEPTTPATSAHALIFRAAHLRDAIAAGLGLLDTDGSQKVIVSSPLHPGEVAPPPDVEWSPLTASGARPVFQAPALDLAVFDHRAAQQRHRHHLGTEIYWLLDGGLTLEIDGQAHALSAGDMAIVNPGAAHLVSSHAHFLACALTIDSIAGADKFPADPVLLPPAPADVATIIWTRWQPRPGQDPAAVADAVVNAACAFVHDALGAPPKLFFLFKTPGDPASDDTTRDQESALWQGALRQAEARLAWPGTTFAFHYHPQSLPVCSSWEAALRISRWTRHASVCALVNMDHVDSRLAPALQLTRLPANLPVEVRHALDVAAANFGHLVRSTLAHKGITVGGYRVHELDPSLLARRGGLSPKDLLEAAIRCYTAGVLPRFAPLQRLLDRYPRLQIRSETFAIHRDTWEALRAARRLTFEHVEATIGLLLGALALGRAVEHVDFGWLVEEGAKSDAAIVDQLNRGLAIVDRLKRSWF